MLAELVLTYALHTNEPLYVREDGLKHKDYGVRLEVTQPLKWGFFFDLSPYVYRSREDGAVGSGGAIARIGWDGEYFGVALYHKSEHSFDRAAKDGRYLNMDLVEFRWKLK